MQGKKKLGTGLASLLGDVNFLDESELNNMIDISLIETNTNQPRKYFDQEAMANLAQSIAGHGVLQPILVSKNDDKYLVIAGERRLRAAKMANLDKVPCIVINNKEKNIDAIAIIENIQRKDLTIFEEALSYSKLIDKFNYTHEELSNILSKSRSTITNMLRLLKLPQQVLDLIAQGLINFSHAKLLMSLDNDDLCWEIAKNIVENNLTVKQLENLLQQKKQEIVSNKIEYNLDSLRFMLKNLGIVDNLDQANISGINKQINKKCKSLKLPKIQLRNKTDTTGNLVISYKNIHELEEIFSRILDE
jgi:ParB family chromosome partitioning protein